MDELYQQLHQRAEQLRYDVHGQIDNMDNPTARVLHQQVKHLEEAVQSQEHPHQIEQRVRVIQQQLSQLEHQPAPEGQTRAMGIGQANSFWHNYEDFRNDVRRMPHF